MWNIINPIKCLTFILICIFIEDSQSVLFAFHPPAIHLLAIVICILIPCHSHFFYFVCTKCRCMLHDITAKLTNFDCMHCVFHLQTMKTFLLLMFLWHLRKCSLLAGMRSFCRYFHRTASSKNVAALLPPPKQTTAHPNRLNSTYN